MSKRLTLKEIRDKWRDDSDRLRRVRSWVYGWAPADLASDGDYQKGYKQAAKDVKKLLEEQDDDPESWTV